MRVLVGALLTLLLAPTSALAGGFATVGLSSTPDGTAPGDTWVVELTILQHGRSETPLSGLRPAVIVSRDDERSRRSFRAMPTGRAGVYRASVVFASAGLWRYRVNDGFAGAIHTYPPVAIGGSSATVSAPVSDSNGGPNVGLALLAAGVAGLGAGLAPRLLRPPRAIGRPAQA
jgi:hypothetical protein